MAMAALRIEQVDVNTLKVVATFSLKEKLSGIPFPEQHRRSCAKVGRSEDTFMVCASAFDYAQKRKFSFRQPHLPDLKF
jgi:hypothetical protein